MRNKGGGLTPEAWAALLALLGGDEAYLKLHAKLVRLFEWKGCRDPEGLADETMDRVARRVLEGVDIQAVGPYIWSVAQLVLKEVWRESQRVELMPDEPPSGPPSDEPPEDRRLECMLRCLASLPQEERGLILEYHDREDRISARRELAAQRRIRMNALRIRAHRLRQRLKTCLERCLGQQP